MNSNTSFSSSGVALSNLLELCDDNAKALSPLSSGMLSYMNAFTGAGDIYFSNNFAIGFQETDGTGSFIGSEIKAEDLGTNQLGVGWDGSEFDLDELYDYAASTSTGLVSGKYYLIR